MARSTSEWVVETAEAGSAVIDVRDLTKRFGNLVAVDHISFSVRRGEVFGILGPNGAGKTTTIEMVETLQQPDGGSIIVDGVDALRFPDEVKRRIGVQLQAAGFYPDLSLTHLIGLFAALYGVRVDAKQVLRRFQLEDKTHAPYAELSGGQKQRFSLATTMLNQPRVIFLDEPTTGLDPQARRNLWEVVREIRAEGTTVVLTTHYMEEAEQLCDRIAIMDRGRIVTLGSPSDLIDQLLASGFRKERVRQEATLEDVFIALTGYALRDE